MIISYQEIDRNYNFPSSRILCLTIISYKEKEECDKIWELLMLVKLKHIIEKGLSA